MDLKIKKSLLGRALSQIMAAEPEMRCWSFAHVKEYRPGQMESGVVFNDNDAPRPTEIYFYYKSIAGRAPEQAHKVVHSTVEAFCELGLKARSIVGPNKNSWFAIDVGQVDEAEIFTTVGNLLNEIKPKLIKNARDRMDDKLARAFYHLRGVTPFDVDGKDLSPEVSIKAIKQARDRVIGLAAKFGLTKRVATVAREVMEPFSSKPETVSALAKRVIGYWEALSLHGDRWRLISEQGIQEISGKSGIKHTIGDTHFLPFTGKAKSSQAEIERFVDGLRYRGFDVEVVSGENACVTVKRQDDETTRKNAARLIYDMSHALVKNAEENIERKAGRFLAQLQDAIPVAVEGMPLDEDQAVMTLARAISRLDSMEKALIGQQQASSYHPRMSSLMKKADGNIPTLLR